MSQRFSFALLAALLTVPAAAQASDCTQFAGLTHCAVGDAVVTTSDDGSLLVDNLGEDGGDGVAISLGQATSWVASLSLEGASGGGSTFSTTARADDQDVSRADLRTTADGGVGLSASFTGGKGRYAALVYNGGRLVGSQGGLDSSRFIVFNRDNEDFLMWLISHWSFAIRLSDGACTWTTGLDQAVTIELPDGVQVTGDEVHLIEEVANGGHYPYTSFDGMTLTGNLSAIGLTDETVYP